MCQSRSYWARWLLFLLTIVVTTTPSVASNFDKVEKSVVRVLGLDARGGLGKGSGTVIADDKVLTNWHVVRGMQEVLIASKGIVEQAVVAEVQWSDRELDLALLRVENLKLPVATLASRELSKSENVWAFGFPGVSDLADINLEVTVSRGVISNFHDTPWNKVIGKHPRGRAVKIIQHDAAINPGNSGGPLIDNCGHIVGVNTVGSPTAHGFFLALHVAEIVSELEALGQNFVKATEEKCESTTSSIIPPLVVPPGDGALLWVPWLILLFLILVAFAFWHLQRQSIGSMERKIHVHPSESLKKRSKAGTKRWRVASFEFIDSKEVKSRLSIQVTEQEHTVEQGGFVIGRHPTLSDETVEHPTVSRRHARFFWKHGDCFIEDMNSSVGTKLNQTRLRPFEPQLIHSRDRVVIGRISFIVNLD